MKALLSIAVLGSVGALVGLSATKHPVVIAEYATPLAGRTRNQRHNALLAGLKLNGTVVLPGQTLSFNDKVQSWSKDQGYVRAPVSFNGQLVSAYGGGVCQTSTTLYNAALIAGMKVIERNRHHFAATYAPPGRDAAVAFSSIDLKLENTSEMPLTIRVKEAGNKLIVQIEGDRPLSKQYTITQVVHERSEPATFNLDGDRKRIRNSGKPGFDVSVYRICGSQRELISHDNYPVMNRIVEGG